MSATPIIRFPPPPPTRNKLSSDQRAKLMRSNSKLGQVLGSTPHVLDLSYVVTKVQEPAAPRPKTPTSFRNPFRAHSRSKSVTRVDMDNIRTCTQSPDSVASSGSSSSSRSTTSIRLKGDELAWRSPYPSQRPPLLKVSVPNPSRRPNLETIPGSPPYGQSEFSFEPPTFSVPSEAAIRREKLRRVKKMLGEGVPTDLIFPSYSDSDSDSEDSPLIPTPTSAMSREWLLVDVQKPLPDVPVPLSASLDRSASPQLIHIPIAKPTPEPPRSLKQRGGHRSRLYKERPKERPSEGAKRLESIKESAREFRPPSLTAVGVSASAGMSGKGKSRRFIEGEVQFDQIGGFYGGVMCI